MNKITPNELPTLLLTVQDVMNITGRSERGAQRLMQKIRIYFNRPPRSPINAFEFSRYMNLKFATVMAYRR